MPLPVAVLQELFAQRSSEGVLELLRLTHPDTDGTLTPLRIANDEVPVSVTDDGEGSPATYQRGAFSIELEPSIEGEIPDVGTLRVDLLSLGDGGEILKAALRSQQSGLLVRVRLIRSSAPNAPFYETPDELVWKDVRWNNFEAEGRLDYPENFDEEPYPGDTYDPFHFPGLF